MGLYELFDKVDEKADKADFVKLEENFFELQTKYDDCVSNIDHLNRTVEGMKKIMHRVRIDQLQAEESLSLNWVQINLRNYN